MDRDALVVEYFDFAQKVAKKYCTSHHVSYAWWDDVSSWAQFGLLKASRKWDGRGIFRAYARRTIKNSIVDGFRYHLGRFGHRSYTVMESSVFERIPVEEQYDDVDQLDFVNSLRSVLDPKEFDFVVTAEFAETKQEVAERWGVTPGRISQVRNSEKVREALAPFFLVKRHD